MSFSVSSEEDVGAHNPDVGLGLGLGAAGLGGGAGTFGAWETEGGGGTDPFAFDLGEDIQLQSSSPPRKPRETKKKPKSYSSSRRRQDDDTDEWVGGGYSSRNVIDASDSLLARTGGGGIGAQPSIRLGEDDLQRHSRGHLRGWGTDSPHSGHDSSSDVSLSSLDLSDGAREDRRRAAVKARLDARRGGTASRPSTTGAVASRPRLESTRTEASRGSTAPAAAPVRPARHSDEAYAPQRRRGAGVGVGDILSSMPGWRGDEMGDSLDGDDALEVDEVSSDADDVAHEQQHRTSSGGGKRNAYVAPANDSMEEGGDSIHSGVAEEQADEEDWASYPAIPVGAQVEARYGGDAGDEWYTGKVQARNPDGTYEVLYDDGDTEDAVRPTYIRQLRQGTSDPTSHVDRGRGPREEADEVAEDVGEAEETGPVSPFGSRSAQFGRVLDIGALGEVVADSGATKKPSVHTRNESSPLRGDRRAPSLGASPAVSETSGYSMEFESTREESMYATTHRVGDTSHRPPHRHVAAERSPPQRPVHRHVDATPSYGPSRGSEGDLQGYSIDGFESVSSPHVGGSLGQRSRRVGWSDRVAATQAPDQRPGDQGRVDQQARGRRTSQRSIGVQTEHQGWETMPPAHAQGYPGMPATGWGYPYGAPSPYGAPPPYGPPPTFPPAGPWGGPWYMGGPWGMASPWGPQQPLSRPQPPMPWPTGAENIPSSADPTVNMPPRVAAALARYKASIQSTRSLFEKHVDLLRHQVRQAGRDAPTSASSGPPVGATPPAAPSASAGHSYETLAHVRSLLETQRTQPLTKREARERVDAGEC